MATTDNVTDSNISWLKPEQVEAMRDAAHEGRHGQRDEAIVTLLYDTGLRRAELASVNRAMIDLDERELRIPPEIQKDYPNDNNPDRAIFELDRSDDLRTVRTLRAYLNTRDDSDTALIRSQKGTRMTGKGVNDVVKRLAIRAAVEPYTYGGRGDPDAIHVADMRTNTVHVVHPDGSRGRRVLDGGDLDDYMAAVERAHGWARRDYGVGLADLLTRGFDA